MQLGSYYQEVAFNDDRVAIKVLLDNPAFKEIRIMLKKDQEMKAHKAPATILVQVVDGAIEFGVNDEVHHFKKGDFISLDAGVVHHLVGKEDSIVRLTLFKANMA